MLNPFNWNPAYAGMEKSLSFNAGLREQWSGLTQSSTDENIGPSTQFINAHLPLYLLRGGLGIQLENDAIGPRRQLGFNVAYNFQTYLGPGILSIGIGGGIFRQEIDGNILRTPSGIYSSQTIDHQDDLLPLGVVNGNIPTFRVGAYYSMEWLEVGIAAIHINEPEIELNQLGFQLQRTLFFGAKAQLNLNDAIQFHPSFLAKSDVVQTQVDLSGYFHFNENFFFGGGVRGLDTNSLDALTIFGGFNLAKNTRIAYGYDITLSGLQDISNGSHELMIQYNLQQLIGAGRPPKVIYNPRNL